MSRVSSKVREAARERAQNRCEYCHIPDDTAYTSYQVDHIIPPIHLGIENLDNFAWSCFHCNNTKWVHIASYDSESQELIPLFHPRLHAWHDHFELIEGVAVGKTAIGRVTIRLLKMNNREQIKARRILIEAGLWES